MEFLVVRMVDQVAVAAIAIQLLVQKLKETLEELQDMEIMGELETTHIFIKELEAVEQEV
jgi:hypothetical protein